MNNGSNDFEVEHPFLNFLNRLLALYWILLLFFIPALALVRIKRAYRRRDSTRSKCEKKYWSNQIIQYWCVLYMATWLYYHLFQDFLPVSFETQASITNWFDFVMGIPGVMWYFITDRSVVLQGDTTQFVFVTFWGVLIVFLVNLLLDYLNVYGQLDERGLYIAPDWEYRKVNAQIEKEEEPKRALSREWKRHKMNHPHNDPDWNKWSTAQQERAVEKWEEELDVIRKKIENCPRASHYGAK